MAGRVPRRAAMALATAVAALLVATGCGKKAPDTAPPPAPATPDATATAPPTTPAAVGPAATGWPSPEDCVTYNPTTVTVTFADGVYTVTDGTQTILTVHGTTDSAIGQKAVALAQRFDERCFIGRSNTRANKSDYVFEYWRNPSGLHPSIPDQDQDCTDYNPNNLTVEDLGADGWRVKDHDHVLHMFDTEADARNGKLVLGQFTQQCFLGNSDEEDQDTISYLL